MPIETRCPHCHKAYRLKDEFLGKKVKCPNAVCAKPFTVEPAPPEPAPKPKPADKKLPVKSAADIQREAEELAAQMFNEQAAAPAEDTRTVEMTCAGCDHKWTVGYDKRGKFVVCPECGFRQKVPDQKVEKKIDWRDPTAGRPSMVKGEELPDDLKEQMTRGVSGQTLLETGVIQDDVEPVPLTVKLQRAFVVLGVVAAAAFGVLYFFKGRQEGKEQRFMDDAISEVEKITDEGMAKGQPQLLKAILLAAAAEHAIRNDSAEQRKLAVERFGQARQLADQQRGPERDAILGELAALIPQFGGDEEQIGKEQRLRWQPGDRTKGPQLNAGPGDVQTELKRVIVALSGSDLDFRLSIARRVARELAKTNHLDLLTEILTQGFAEAEQSDAAAHIGLTLHRDGNAAGAKAVAGQLARPLSPAAQVLCEVTGTALKPEEKPFSLAPSGQLSPGNRMYGAILNAINKDGAAAIAIATRDGTPDDKLRALAAVADWSDNPAEAFTKGEAALTNEVRGKTFAVWSVYRLAVLALKAGQADVGEKLLAGLPDEGHRAWAKAEALRGKLESTKGQKVELPAVEQDKSKVRAAHGWATVMVTRHNAAATGDQSAAKEYAGWPEGVFKGSGFAGLALGIQDRKK